MADQEGAWTTIESDPGVFTELIEQMGVQGVQVEELYSLDEHSLQELRPVYGLIFLFKWQQEPQQQRTELSDIDSSAVYFAKQVIPNACATIAIVSVLFNRPELKIGEQLSNLRSFSADLPPDVRGMTIGSSEGIRQAHNSFASPNPFMSDEKLEDKDDDAYHFIAYVPVGGVLYELDGLKPSPIPLCRCSEDDWLQKVCPSIQERIARYSQKEIRFNLLALVRNRAEALQEQLDSLGSQAAMDTDGGPASTSNAAEPDDGLDAVRQMLTDSLLAEKQKLARWRDENIRRRHNYMPLLFTLLDVLAQNGHLQPVIDKAKAQAAKPPEQA